MRCRTIAHSHARCARIRQPWNDDGWELVDGKDLEAAIERLLLANPQSAYLHIHYAAPGCYAARVERV